MPEPWDTRRGQLNAKSEAGLRGYGGTGSRIWAQVEDMQALWSPDDSITRSAARHGGASLGVCATGVWSYFGLILPYFAQFPPSWNGNIYSATVCWTHITGFLMPWGFQLRDDLSLGGDSELKVWKSTVKDCGKIWSWIGCISNHETALSLWEQVWKDIALKWNAWMFSGEEIDLWLIVRGQDPPLVWAAPSHRLEFHTE